MQNSKSITPKADLAAIIFMGGGKMSVSLRDINFIIAEGDLNFALCSLNFDLSFMPWESLRSILPRAVKTAGLREKLTSVRVLESSARILKARWGEGKANLIEFMSFNAGTLKAIATSPAAMQTLHVEKIAFVNDLNRLLGEKAVLKLDIRSQGF